MIIQWKWEKNRKQTKERRQQKKKLQKSRVPEIFETGLDEILVRGVFVERMQKLRDEILPENDLVIIEVLNGALSRNWFCLVSIEYSI